MATRTAATRQRDETVGQRLRRLRHEAGLSQRSLSGPGVSYAYISRIEAGARRPSTKALRLIAERLGVEADYLEFGEAGIKASPTFRSMQRRIVRLEARIRRLEAERRDETRLIEAAVARATRELAAARNGGGG